MASSVMLPAQETDRERRVRIAKVRRQRREAAGKPAAEQVAGAKPEDTRQARDKIAEQADTLAAQATALAADARKP